MRSHSTYKSLSMSLITKQQRLSPKIRKQTTRSTYYPIATRYIYLYIIYLLKSYFSFGSILTLPYRRVGFDTLLVLLEHRHSSYRSIIPADPLGYSRGPYLPPTVVQRILYVRKRRTGILRIPAGVELTPSYKDQLPYYHRSLTVDTYIVILLPYQPIVTLSLLTLTV